MSERGKFRFKNSLTFVFTFTFFLSQTIFQNFPAMKLTIFTHFWNHFLRKRIKFEDMSFKVNTHRVYYYFFFIFSLNVVKTSIIQLLSLFSFSFFLLRVPKFKFLIWIKTSFWCTFLKKFLDRWKQFSIFQHTNACINASYTVRIFRSVTHGYQ